MPGTRCFSRASMSSWPHVAIALLVMHAAPLRAQVVKQFPVTLSAFSSPILMDTLMVTSEVEAVKSRVFNAALKVFGDLKIAIDTRDSVRGTIGTTHFVKSSYLGDMQMSRVFNCGTGLTGPNADNFRIES